MNVFQERALEIVAKFADRFDCLKSLYLFGSVARGETAEAEDVDVAAEFKPMKDLVHGDDFQAFQSAFEDWQYEASVPLSRPVRFSYAYIDGRDDDCWRAIESAARNPVARVGKALMVATPRVKG
jgi:predicted nucleotidyltransferase